MHLRSGLKRSTVFNYRTNKIKYFTQFTGKEPLAPLSLMFLKTGERAVFHFKNILLDTYFFKVILKAVPVSQKLILMFERLSLWTGLIVAMMFFIPIFLPFLDN